MRETGLYIHIPFCIKKCNYCDFNSLPLSNNESLKEEYCNALVKELSRYEEEHILIKSVYFGGGTPTVLSGEQLENILNSVFKKFRLKNNAEITVESNPKTVDFKKLDILKQTGVNRLSIGLQSTDDKVLKFLGRIHTYEDFLESYELARKVKFNNINVDFIFGIPQQTLKEIEKTTREIMNLHPEHISAYNLSIEPCTKLYDELKQGKLIPLDEAEESEMYYLIIDLLKNGYLHYEISNFAKTGKESTHNKTYWDNDEYLGIGAGAWSKFNNDRFQNEKDYLKYIRLIKSSGSAIVYKESLNKEIEMKESVFLGLRLIQGLNLLKWKSRFGEDFLVLFKDKIAKLKDLNLITQVKDYIKLTKKGLFLSNEVFVEFM